MSTIDRILYRALYAPVRPPRRKLTRARRRAIVTYTLPKGGTS
jgi:hypothetical protein